MPLQRYTVHGYSRTRFTTQSNIGNVPLQKSVKLLSGANYFMKSLMLDVWRGPKCVPVLCENSANGQKDISPEHLYP